MEMAEQLCGDGLSFAVVPACLDKLPPLRVTYRYSATSLEDVAVALAQAKIPRPSDKALGAGR